MVSTQPSRRDTFRIAWARIVARETGALAAFVVLCREHTQRFFVDSDPISHNQFWDERPTNRSRGKPWKQSNAYASHHRQIEPDPVPPQPERALLTAPIGRIEEAAGHREVSERMAKRKAARSNVPT